MNVPEIIAVALFVLGSGQAFRTYLQKRKIQNNFDYAMQVVAKEAVKRAKAEHKVDLDYSPDSIELLEELLGRIHESHLKHPLSDTEISVLCLRWGAHIGEALKRVHPGKWERDSEKMGPGTAPPVYDSGEQAFPRTWVYKRIVDGPYDSVASKFYVFSHPELLKGTNRVGTQNE